VLRRLICLRQTWCLNYPIAIAVNRSGKRAYVALWKTVTAVAEPTEQGKGGEEPRLLPPNEQLAQFHILRLVLGPGLIGKLCTGSGQTGMRGPRGRCWW